MSFLERVRVEVAKTGDEGDSGRFGKKFTYVNAKVVYDSKSIGSISATLVNRQAIAEGDFLPTFDDHSADMEWIGCSLLENKLGRTRLQSLREWDDPEFYFMYITSFEIEDAHSKNSDVATAALYHFLRDPQYIRGELDYGCWACSSAAVVIPPQEAADRVQGSTADKDDPQFDRHFVDPFLRNGFFQEPALIRKDSDNARILVSSYGHWKSPNPRSQSEVATINLVPCVKKKPSGKDCEILEAVERVCTSHPHEVNYAAIMVGAATYEPPGDKTTVEQLASLNSTIVRLVQEGGSLAASTALHAACDHNKYKIVKFLLDTFPGQKMALLGTKNPQGQTPLMVAAYKATGRLSINGIDDTKVIDLLLGNGADKSTTDSIGMTAYGYFRKRSKTHVDITHPHCRGKLVALESKLCPPLGPTMVDLNGGHGSSTGFVDYGPEDEEADREMGRGKYASSSEDDEDGDY